MSEKNEEKKEKVEKITVTLNCEKHGEYTGEKMILPPLRPEGEYLEFNPMCPICDRENREAEEREKREEENKNILRAMRSMNIDKKFYDSTLENFNAYNDELKKHLETCLAFAENPDGKLVMIGEHGNGKTHLAIGILKKLGGVIYTAMEMKLEIQSTYNYNNEISEKEFFDEICSIPLLVIDEVEKIKESEWKSNWMSHIVGKRYNRELPIIFIANCHTKKDCPDPNPPCNKCLEYHLENDVLSRIIEDGIIMKFNSKDYRKILRERKFGQQK